MNGMGAGVNGMNMTYGTTTTQTTLLNQQAQNNQGEVLTMPTNYGQNGAMNFNLDNVVPSFDDFRFDTQINVGSSMGMLD